MIFTTEQIQNEIKKMRKAGMIDEVFFLENLMKLLGGKPKIDIELTIRRNTRYKKIDSIGSPETSEWY